MPVLCRYCRNYALTQPRLCLSLPKKLQLCVISGFCRAGAGNCAILCCYTASRCNLLLPLQDNLSVPYSGVKNLKGIKKRLDSWPLKMGPVCCPKTSVTNYLYPLCNNTDERSSQISINLVIGFVPKLRCRMQVHWWNAL